MQGGSPESVQGVLFDASFYIVQITIPACQCKVSNVNKTPSDRSCMVLAIACVMLRLKEVQFFQGLVNFTG